MPGTPGDVTFISTSHHCPSYPTATTPARTGALSIHAPSHLLLSPAPPATLRSSSALPILDPEATEGHPRGPPAPLL